MSKTQKKASETAHEVSGAAPVYDFFYYDAARVGSFIGQLDDSGHLQTVKQSENVTRTRKPEHSLKASVSLPGIGLPTEQSPEAGFTFTRGAQEGATQQNERTYDPMWVNAINFKEFIEQEGRLVEDLSQAVTGSFVFLKGQLSILDMSALKVFWQNSDIQKRWIRNKETQQTAKKVIGDVDKKAGETELGNTRLVFDLLAQMPHGIHCIIKSGTIEAWGPIRGNSMVSPIGDITLLHGSEIPGDWKMIAIMDARPNTEEEVENLVASIPDTPAHGIRRAVFGLANLARKSLGRPAGVYGVTPLLIYRDVTGF